MARDQVGQKLWMKPRWTAALARKSGARMRAGCTRITNNAAVSRYSGAMRHSRWRTKRGRKFAGSRSRLTKALRPITRPDMTKNRSTPSQPILNQASGPLVGNAVQANM